SIEQLSNEPPSGTAISSVCDGYHHLTSTQTSSYNYKKGWGELTYVTLEGDFTFTAELKSKSSNGVAGIMVRKGGHAESIMGFVGQHGFNMDGGMTLDGNSRMIRKGRSRGSRRVVLTVTRQGDIVTFTQGRSVLLQLSLDLGTSAQVGLFLSSTNNQEATASFNNVSYSTNNTNASIQMSPLIEQERAVSLSSEQAITVSSLSEQEKSVSPLSEQARAVSPLRGLGGGKNTANQLTDLKTFPNPTNGPVNIDLKAFIGNTATLKVQNLNGQVIYNKNLGLVAQSQQQIDLSRLEAGMYLLIIESTGQIATSKLLIQ
ncbi:MAG: T9SS type A sorting domain-containing protein, partial [Bacteroidota bacterium]